jgi:hypothetical protein
MPIPPSPGEPPPGEPAEELLAMVAHELRRPLTALLGALATVQRRDAALPAAQRRELLAIARRQVPNCSSWWTSSSPPNTTLRRP